MRDGLRRMPMKRNLSHLRFALETTLVFGAYFFTAYFTLLWNPTGSLAVFIWPAAAVALASTYFLGYRVAPAVAAAAFLANYLHGATAAAAVAIAIGNALEAMAGNYFLRYADFNPLLKRLRDSLVFTATALSSSLVAAMIGATALVIAGALREQAFSITVLTWWIGDALGMMIFGAFLIRWFCRPLMTSERRLADYFEYVFFFTTLAIVTLVIFWKPIPYTNATPLLYLTFVPITWGALRIGPRMITLAIVLIAGVAISGTLSNAGPFTPINATDLILLQTYLGTMAMIALFFVSTVEERKEAIKSAQKHVEELQEDVEEISAADRAKNEFIAILSHELRNPLAPVLSSLELLQLNADKIPEFKGSIATMHEQIGRITRLLDDLLDITRIARKKFNLKMDTVRLQDILTHSVTTASDVISKRGHTLRTAISDEPIWIEADRLRLEQVIVNLLNNAAKYTPPGGLISLVASVDDGFAEIRVRDTGLGIPATMLKSIFEPFRQAHAGIEGGTGLGIGLSLAKRFVELHGGDIEAQSEGPGRGSEFIVRLPTREMKLLVAPEGALTAVPPGAASSASQSLQPQLHSDWKIPKRRRSILIVDDNRAAAEGIAKLMRHAGHRAETAIDGRSARKVLENFRPDIVLLDIGLPGENGYEVARWLRNHLDPAPYLVALTGFGQESDIQKAHEAGFDEHLIKPVSIADLEKVLAKKI